MAKGTKLSEFEKGEIAAREKSWKISERNFEGLRMQ